MKIEKTNGLGHGVIDMSLRMVNWSHQTLRSTITDVIKKFSCGGLA